MMIFRFSTPVITALLWIAANTLVAQGFGVKVDTVQAKSGAVACVPVRAIGFKDIAGFQYSLNWDPQILTFDHAQNLNLPGWMTSDFNSPAPGNLLIVWGDPNGLFQTRADGAVLYEACFKVIGILGTSSDLTPGANGFPPGSGGAEAYNKDNVNIWTPSLNVPGLVEVTEAAGVLDIASKSSSILLSPNPTSTASQAVFVAAASGTGIWTVTDVQGKKVMEQKTALHAGENRFDIPASVLGAKGMYQISLLTGDKVFTEKLSVQ